MNTEQKEQKPGQFLGKVKRVQCSPLTETDRFMLEKLAVEFQTSESKILGIALHDWLKNNFNSYELLK